MDIEPENHKHDTEINKFLSNMSSIQERVEYDQSITELIYKNRILGRNFSGQALSKLDLACYLEKYLIPFTEQAQEPSFFLSIIALINYKNKSNIFFWEYYMQNQQNQNIQQKFCKIVEFIINQKPDNLQYIEQSQLLMFLTLHFQRLEQTYISNSLTRLIGPPLLLSLPKPYIKYYILQYPHLMGILEKILKTKNLKDSKEANYFKDLLNHLLIIIISQDLSSNKIDSDSNLKYVVSQILSLFIELLSQIPTRKFIKPLLEGNHITCKLNLSILFEESQDLKDLNKQLHNLIKYPLNEKTGEMFSQSTIQLLRSDFFKKIQEILFQKYQIQLGIMEIETLNFIKDFDHPLEDLVFLCKKLNIPLPFENVPQESTFKNDNKFLQEHISIFEYVQEVFQQAIPNPIDNSYKDISLLPSEKIIWDLKRIPDEQDVPKLLKLPRINLQFLSMQDYLLRNFHLVRYESCFEIRQDLQDTIQRMNPKFKENGELDSFQSWARMGVQMKQFTIHEVKQPLIGQISPQRVMAEIEYSVQGMPTYLRKEWESLQKHDILQMVSFDKNSCFQTEFTKKYGVSKVRGCEIIAQFDEAHNKISNLHNDQAQKTKIEGVKRSIQVLLDPYQYREDLKHEQNLDVYKNLTLMVRRKTKENTFKATTSSIQDLLVQQNSLPNFIQDLILGYGDPIQSTPYEIFKQNPNSESYTSLLQFSFYDTFLDEQHFNECFLNNSLIPQELKSKYQKYQQNQLKRPNKIRFSQQQVSAIIQGTLPGLSLVIGPPGTGKTDVVVQTIALLYRNYPTQKILVLTHSNQALNDIFQKINNLDTIEEKSLIRLGIGGLKLFSNKNSDYDFSKYGRINYLLERRLNLLDEVKKLNTVLTSTSNEFTCETAGLFFKHQVQSRWQEYLNKMQNLTDEECILQFPFYNFVESSVYCQQEKIFQYKHQSKQDALAYFDKIQQLFIEIEDLRPFELLRHNHERSNFFVCQQARVVAMTCTHASIKRQDFLKIGFEYDSIVCEEAGQVLEVQSFIAMNLQKSNKLKRVIMIGDENQLPPIIKHTALQKAGNMEQSLFKRLIRTGTYYYIDQIDGSKVK